jgi:hypothetical protein
VGAWTGAAGMSRHRAEEDAWESDYPPLRQLLAALTLGTVLGASVMAVIWSYVEARG